MLVAVRENVATLKKQGRTRDEIGRREADRGLSTRSSAASVIDPGFFTRLVYEGV